ncbi:5'-3' exonuclease [Kineococcus rhizosphaerae]|uniref:5'-3' exonuclease n=1 Tax=Kineococcus rhizosphaerae TaxID=559628 RepID=A0A2T0RAG3_9ACTN|nr:5'-3' exonuclease [Kineococcus rhizosphaerae]PRY18120.1 5'-3' exonuclease [Kineococcus rhizosphaerae]
MPSRRDSLMLLDSASLYFRAFHGVPDSVTAPDGTPVNAVRGFLDSVAFLLTTHRPTRLVACWDDDWRPAFRVQALPSYKAHRVGPDGGEDAPSALLPQVDVIVDVLTALGLARVGAPGYEADDVIATLAVRPARTGGDPGDPVDVVTGDRDLFQLVDDTTGVRVLYCGKGVRKAEAVTQDWLLARYAVPTGAAYADMAVLRGDPSDGLPGVPGIGEKTAAALITRYGDLPALLAAADDPAGGLTPAQRTKLTAARDYLAAAPVVVQTVRDVPLPDLDDTLPAAPADPGRLDALAERWGLRSSVDRVLSALAAVPD